MNRHLRKLAVVLGTCLMALGMAACGAPSPASIPSPTRLQTDAPPEPLATIHPDITPEVDDDPYLYPTVASGDWVPVDYDPSTTHLEADVSFGLGNVTVNWVSPDGEALYWKGTYDRPREDGDWSWTSHADVAQTSQGPMACQDATKDFFYDAEARTLTFEAEIDGIPQTVTMVRPE